MKKYYLILIITLVLLYGLGIMHSAKKHLYEDSRICVFIPPYGMYRGIEMFFHKPPNTMGGDTIESLYGFYKQNNMKNSLKKTEEHDDITYYPYEIQVKKYENGKWNDWDRAFTDSVLGKNVIKINLGTGSFIIGDGDNQDYLIAFYDGDPKIDDNGNMISSFTCIKKDNEIIQVTEIYSANNVRFIINKPNWVTVYFATNKQIRLLSKDSPVLNLK